MASIKKWVVRRASSGGSMSSLGLMSASLRRSSTYGGGEKDSEEKEREMPRRSASTSSGGPSRRTSAAALRRARRTQKKRQSFVFEGGKRTAIENLWESEADGQGGNSAAAGTSSMASSISVDSMDDSREFAVEAQHEEPELTQEEPQPPALTVKELRWHCSVDEQLEEKRIRLLEKPSKLPRLKVTRKQLIFEFPQEAEAEAKEQPVEEAPSSFRVMDDSMSSIRAVSLDAKDDEDNNDDDDDEEDDTSRTSDDSSVSSGSYSSDEDSDIVSLQDDSDVYLDVYIEEDARSQQPQDYDLNASSFHTTASF